MAPPGTTIIIKKIKKGGHSHHGGAWKVAYADFVTAMMSFFLLLWLLTATPVENLKGLADYFSPTLGVQGKLGIGYAGGRAPDSEGMSQGNWASMGLVFGAPPSGPIIKFPDKDNKIEEENNKVNFQKMHENATQELKESKDLADYQDSILIEQTPEGLKINIVDTENRPMFKEGSAELEEPAKRILAKIATMVKEIPNYIQIAGSTSSVVYSADGNYTNWELSADRANAARRYLLKVGVETAQIVRILALADQDLLDMEHPEAVKNSRVVITLLRKSMLAYNRQPAPEEIIMGPIEAGLKTFVQDKKKVDAEDPQHPTVSLTEEEMKKQVPETKHFDDDTAKEAGQSESGEPNMKKDKKKSTTTPPKKKKKKSASAAR